jgi:phosphate transport system substrate-binding protein
MNNIKHGFLILLLTIFLTPAVIRAADPSDAELHDNPKAITAEIAPVSPPQVPTSAIEPTPGSKLAEALAKIAKAHAAFAEEVAPLVAKFPTYSPTAGPASGSLRIAGSDSLGALLLRAAESYKNIRPDASVEVRQGGSLKGLEALQAGACDMASISRDLSAEERAAISQATGRIVFTVPVGLGAVCVYVNADNPILGLTKAQCNGLFSIEHSLTPSPLIRWNQLDPSSPLGSAGAPLYIEGKLSGALQIFRDWCMPGAGFTTINRFIEPGPSSVVNACCAYPAAIGIAGFAHRQPRARTVPLAGASGKPFIEPTVTTIRNGTYPMRQRMNLVFLAPSAGQIPPLTKDFLRFLLSQDGQDMVAKNGLIPVEITDIPAFIGNVSNGQRN